MNKIVRPVGPLDAKIAIVGTSPGAHDIIYGYPFAGESGKILNNLLTAAGINRRACYITNVFKQYLPVSDDDAGLKDRIDLSKAVARISPEYLAAEQALWDELKTVDCNVIVALGNVASYALTRHSAIMSWRGSIVPAYADSQLNKKVYITMHPTTITRMPEFGHVLAFDFARIAQEAKTPDLPDLAYSIKTVPTFEEAMLFIESCNDCEMLAIDIEVFRKEVYCISIAKSPKEAISITFYLQGKEVFSLTEETMIWAHISKLLASPKHMIMGHNLAFDAGFLFRRYGIVITNKFDTMVAHAILFPGMPKSLAFVTSIYTKQPYYKDTGKEWFKYGDIDDHSFFIYNALDSLVCYAAAKKMLDDLVKTRNYETFKWQMRLLNVLLYMQERGIKVDTDMMQAESTKLLELEQDALKQLHSLAGFALNPKSPKQLCEYFYTTRRYPVYKQNNSPSVNDRALKQLARKGAPEAKLIQVIRSTSKLRSTYLDVKLNEETGRFCAAFNPVGTTYGRTSSSSTIFGEGTNLQNFPPKLRNIFRIDDGYIGFSIDLSQAENRVVAYLCPDANMIKAFEDGIDVHKLTASLIFNKPIEEISDEPGSCPIGDGTHSERDWGKKSNHGLNYGMGANAFSLMHEIPLKDATFIVESYHNAYPGIRTYYKNVESQIQTTHYLTNLLGRRCRFFGKYDMTSAYSFIPQSTVADIVNRYGACFCFETTGIREHLEMLNIVHDSIDFQLPISLGWDRINYILRQIVNSLQVELTSHNYHFTIPADTSICLNLRDKLKIKNLTAETDLSSYYTKLLESN